MLDRPYMLRVVAIVAICYSVSSISAAFAADAWPQWRGPDRDGQVAGTTWPDSLSEGRLTLRWSVDQGPSYSGPIVVGDRVFVTETKDKKFEVVRALDRGTGKQLWETEWEGSTTVPFFAAANGSWIRSTPVYSEGRLYVAGIRDLLVCLDAESGQVVWRLDFVAETGSGVPSFGCASSPLVYEGHVYIQAGSSLAKVNQDSGDIVWQTLKDNGGMMGGAFSSPVVAELHGQTQLVVQTRAKLAGVDPADGAVLWSEEIPAFRGMNIVPPTVLGNRIFTSSYGGRSLMFEVTRQEDSWSIREVWNHKSQGYMSSPMVVDGHIYLHLRNQRLVCLNAETGEACWTTEPFGKYWSMVANGKRLLALDQTGQLLLIEASPEEFKLVGRQTVAEDSWAHLGISGNELFVRDLKAMKVFQWQ